jgi:hypothetical protein
MTILEFFIPPTGDVMVLYQEFFETNSLGPLTITRASHVEPDQQGCWWADLEPVQGPKLGPFNTRTQAIEAETQWLTEQYLPYSTKT